MSEYLPLLKYPLTVIIFIITCIAIYPSAKKPSTQFTYARQWTPLFAFVLLLHPTVLLVSDPSNVRYVGLVLTPLFFCIVIFFCGWVYGVWERKKATVAIAMIDGDKGAAAPTQKKVGKLESIEISNKLISDDDFYLQATQEVEGGNQSSAMWAKAMALCEGDEGKAKYKYISLRVVELGKENAAIKTNADGVSR